MSSALEVIFYNEMRYINLRFTYLLTYLLTYFSVKFLIKPRCQTAQTYSTMEQIVEQSVQQPKDHGEDQVMQRRSGTVKIEIEEKAAAASNRDLLLCLCMGQYET